MMEQHAEAVDVASGRGIAAAEELGGEVERRSCERRRCVVDLAAGAEVHQHRTPIVADHHVRRLDVAVNESGRVHRGDGAAQLDAERGDLACGESLAVLDDLLQGSAGHPFHPETDAAVDQIGAVERHHVGMTHARQHPALFDDRVARLLGVARAGAEGA